MKNNKSGGEQMLELREPAGAWSPAPLYSHECEAQDREHLRKFLQSVRRRWWLALGIVALCTVLTAFYMSRQHDVYEAEAQVQVDLENVNAAVASSKAGAFAVNPVNDPAYFNTQLQILTRASLLRRVVRTLNLERDPEFNLARINQPFPFGGRAFAAGSTLSAAAPTVAYTGQNAQPVPPETGTEAAGLAQENLDEAARLAPYVEMIRSNLKVEPVKETRLPIKETRLINITFSHPNPQTAARVVNAVANTFVVSNLERKTEANTSTGDILHQRIGELQTQIRNQETQLLDYARSHQILSLDASQNTVVERLVGLNRQLLEAENERKMAEASYRAALEPGAVDALAEGTIKEAAEAESKLAGLRQRRALLLVEATEEWPEVKEVDNQIAVLENQLKEVRRRAASTVMTNLGTRYRQAQAREQALRASFDRQRGETLTQNAAAINYRIMQQEIETNKNLLDGMLQRNKENEALFAGMRNNIHVSDYAIAPQVPVGPRRMLNTAVVFALSFGFGIGLSVFLGYMDNTVRSTDDVRKVLHLPTLASIPLVGAAGLSRRRRRIPSALPERAGDGAHALELLLNSDAPESLTEAYRQLRTSMLLSAQHGQLKSLLVTSSVPGEGKTTMAVNTAVSLARTGALVLLVDADLRKPRLHSLFGLDNKVGLSTVLAEAMEGADALKAVVHHPKSGLDVLTSGPILPSSAELLGTEQMRRLTAMLRSVYDYIVIDSPPVAPFADGVLLSSLVDGVVLVIDSRQNSREVVLHSYGLLQSAGANICGVALNKFTGQQYDYKHYYAEQ